MKSIIVKITAGIIAVAMIALAIVNFVKIPFDISEIRSDMVCSDGTKYFGFYANEEMEEIQLLEKDLITNAYWYKGDRYIEIDLLNAMTVTAKLMPCKSGNEFYVGIDHRYNW